MDDSNVTVLMPVRNAGRWLDASLWALVRSQGDVRANVRVLVNGSTDDTVDIAKRFVTRFFDLGWSLDIVEYGAIGKIETLRRAMRDVDPDRPVLMLDSRVHVHPHTIERLLAGVEMRDVVSGHLRYPPSGDWMVRAFSRAYAASPYARTPDLKGTCVLFSPASHHILRDAPDVAADDRYYLASVPRARRGRVEGADVDYFFAPTGRQLLRQQRRWVSSNKFVDELFGDYERNAHEDVRGPHFADPLPSLVDRAVYVGVLGFARISGKLFPVRRSTW